MTTTEIPCVVHADIDGVETNELPGLRRYFLNRCSQLFSSLNTTVLYAMAGARLSKNRAFSESVETAFKVLYKDPCRRYHTWLISFARMASTLETTTAGVVLLITRASIALAYNTFSKYCHRMYLLIRCYLRQRTMSKSRAVEGSVMKCVRFLFLRKALNYGSYKWLDSL